jgi:hypothetical protein
MARQTSSTELRFNFIGWQDGWYVLQLLTRGRPALTVHALQNQVLDWLIDQGITPNDLSYLANGNTGDGPVVPALADGSAMCLLLRRAPDVLRFEKQFGCRGITAETVFAALRAEASVHRFVVSDIALIAYDAVRRLALVFGEDFPEWDDRDTDDQQFFLQLVREYLEHPERPAETMHAAWVDRRLLEGWSYAADVDLTAKRHPSIVPFAKLSDRDQATTRLTASSIASLVTLLRRHA